MRARAADPSPARDRPTAPRATGEENLGRNKGVRCVLTGPTRIAEPEWQENLLDIAEHGHWHLPTTRVGDCKEIETGRLSRWQRPTARL